NAEKQAEEIFSSISSSEAQTVRVPLADLDSLANMVGELVINRIRLVQIAQAIENNSLAETVAQMSRLISQLQDHSMEMRLVPLDYIFAPYPRMVRDMAVGYNKEVDLLINVSGIGLDRSIQDEINEPLLHLLKNAVIHGIEEPGDRKRQKKPARGKIKLLARRERDFVVIELSDDGKGIDIEEVKEVSVRRGFISKEELSALSPREVIMLTTYPGYSRAKKVTEAAGRGVGLNAAKVKVESLGGSLKIDSKLGEGTILSIKLPMTTAVLPTMLVGIGGETYCIPLSSIIETIKVSAGDIKTIEQHQVISHRDTVLPLIRLRERFGFASSRTSPPSSRVEGRISTLSLVVVEAGGRKAGLVVDSLLGQQEVVIKPLSGILREIEAASGATILATGKVALIVDVTSLLSKR
ncbi:MAG: chemotaxis protein CheA, partial [Thermodesulfobacteriota bacterium]